VSRSLESPRTLAPMAVLSAKLRPGRSRPKCCFWKLGRINVEFKGADLSIRIQQEARKRQIIHNMLRVEFGMARPGELFLKVKALSHCRIDRLAPSRSSIV
jgi:hypothetical protein